MPDCLPSGNPVLQVQSLRGELLIDQVTGDINKYDYSNKLFISSGKIGHDTAEELRSFLNDKGHRWLKVEAPCLSYRLPIKLTFLYIERGTDQYIYK